MGDFREKVVARILNGPRHIQVSVVSRIDPAPDDREDLLVDTRTFYLVHSIDHLLFQSGDGGNGLKGGTRRLHNLCGIVVKREGQIIIQLAEIGGVHGSRHQIIVIAGVSYQGPHLSGSHIGHRASGGTRVKGQLSRRDLKVGYLFHHKGKGIVRSP